MASPGRTRPAPLLGPTTASSMLVGASCLVALFDAWTSWYRHGVAIDYVAGVPGVGVADLTSASSAGSTVDTLYVATMIAAAVALLVWLSRLRANARLRGRAGHRLPRVLAVGVWFALCLFAAVATVLFGANGPVAESTVESTVESAGESTGESTLPAVVDTFGAGGLCVAGVVLIMVIRRTTRRELAETDQRGRAMR